MLISLETPVRVDLVATGTAQVLAEKEAWRLAEQHHLDLVAVCPNFIQGPALSPTLSGTSVGHLKVCLLGCGRVCLPLV